MLELAYYVPLIAVWQNTQLCQLHENLLYAGSFGITRLVTHLVQISFGKDRGSSLETFVFSDGYLVYINIHYPRIYDFTLRSI